MFLLQIVVNDMGKILERVHDVELKLKSLPEEKVNRLRESVGDLPYDMFYQFMNWQSELFASGVIDKEDAMFLYTRIPDWNRAKLSEKIVIMKLMEEYATIKLKRESRLKSEPKRKTLRKASVTKSISTKKPAKKKTK
jgi:hypothetical protein